MCENKDTLTLQKIYEAVRDKNISYSAFRVYVCLITLADNKENYGMIDASRDDLGKKMYISGKTVSTNIRILKKLKLINRIRTHKSQNTITIIPWMYEGDIATYIERRKYVYLLKSGKYYKIGISKDVNKRVKELGTLPPFDIEILGYSIFENAQQIERDLHLTYDNKRVNGEWFTLSQQDVDDILGLFKGD